MSGTECIVYKYITQGSQLFGEVVARSWSPLRDNGCSPEELTSPSFIAQLQQLLRSVLQLPDQQRILLPDQEARRDAAATGARDSSGFGSPLGFPRWEQRITFPPSAISFLMVGRAATRRFSSVILPSLKGNVKVAAYQDTFSFYIDIINRFFV